jgi:thioredoxin-like negative regulator of GroEL
MYTIKKRRYFLQVQGFPTLIFYKNGRKFETFSGARNLDSLSKFTYKNLNTKDEL